MNTPRKCRSCLRPLPSEHFEPRRAKCNACRGLLTPEQREARRAERQERVRLEREAKRAKEHARTAPMKTCRVCNHTYPKTELHFYPRPDSFDGFRPQCIQCYIDRQTT